MVHCADLRHFPNRPSGITPGVIISTHATTPTCTSWSSRERSNPRARHSGPPLSVLAAEDGFIPDFKVVGLPIDLGEEEWVINLILHHQFVDIEVQRWATFS